MKGKYKSYQRTFEKTNRLKSENKELRFQVSALEKKIKDQERVIYENQSLIEEITSETEGIKREYESCIREAKIAKDRYHCAYLEIISMRKKYSKEFNNIIKETNKEFGNKE